MKNVQKAETSFSSGWLVSIVPATWKQLLSLAAAADMVVLVVIAAALGDRESLALALLFLVAVGLLRFRSNLIGAVLLGLLSADVMAFMLPAALSNARSGEGVVDLLIPLSLTAISLVGLIAAVLVIFGLLIRRSRAQTASLAPRIVGVAAGSLFVSLLIVGVVAGSEGDQPRVGDLILTADNTAFSQEELTASAGEVSLYLANKDLFWHTFTIGALDVDLKVPVRGERRLAFSAAPGTYEFYCRIPGHKAAGMKGTLTVR